MPQPGQGIEKINLIGQGKTANAIKIKIKTIKKININNLFFLIDKSVSFCIFINTSS